MIKVQIGIKGKAELTDMRYPSHQFRTIYSCYNSSDALLYLVSEINGMNINPETHLIRIVTGRAVLHIPLPKIKNKAYDNQKN